jgi:hypothetical protein
MLISQNFLLLIGNISHCGTKYQPFAVGRIMDKANYPAFENMTGVSVLVDSREGGSPEQVAITCRSEKKFGRSDFHGLLK